MCICVHIVYLYVHTHILYMLTEILMLSYWNILYVYPDLWSLCSKQREVQSCVFVQLWIYVVGYQSVFCVSALPRWKWHIAVRVLGMDCQVFQADRVFTHLPQICWLWGSRKSCNRVTLVASFFLKKKSHMIVLVGMVQFATWSELAYPGTVRSPAFLE